GSRLHENRTGGGICESRDRIEAGGDEQGPGTQIKNVVHHVPFSVGVMGKVDRWNGDLHQGEECRSAGCEKALEDEKRNPAADHGGEGESVSRVTEDHAPTGRSPPENRECSRRRNSLASSRDNTSTDRRFDNAYLRYTARHSRNTLLCVMSSASAAPSGP